MRSFLIVHRAGCTTRETRTRSAQWHRCPNVLPMGVPSHPWALRFRQYRFHHIVQALQSRTVHVFRYALLSQHAIVPSPFQVQVSWFASQSISLNCGHLWWQFLPCVTWRTVSWHTARAGEYSWVGSSCVPFDRWSAPFMCSRTRLTCTFRCA
jgi:hypothetical protein